MRKTSPDSIWAQWLRGEVDLSEKLYTPEPEKETAVEPYLPVHRLPLMRHIMHRSHALYVAAAAMACVVLFTVLILTAANLPAYGDPAAPTDNEVARRYVENGTEETGAVNTVAGMILDYRAFDTLGESFVLFTAMCAVTVLMAMGKARKPLMPEADIVNYYSDPIVKTVSKFIIPVILVFGVYILLNGHLSPGGGFSGGAILASALIIFAMVWGEERAHDTIRVGIIKGVTLVALGFYACSKTYSFYTGANHLHSVISPGVPGRILSAGLILPLNVAVGFVVCCTMYSFYMYFRRGAL